MNHHHNPVFLYLLVLVFLALPLFPTASLATAPTISAHGTLSISTSGNVTTVVMYNPPINLFDLNLAADLYDFLSSLDPANRTTPPPKVVIFRSGDPEIFNSHIDLYAFVPPFTTEKNALFQLYNAGIVLLQNLTSTIFIGELNGLTTGSGTEWLVRMDMRFAGPKARAGSDETTLGIFHVNGLQYYGRLVNKGRAMQYLLSGDSIDCKTGKEIGFFNDCFRSEKELQKNVLALAHRIALRPEQGLRATKIALQSLDPSPSSLAADLAVFARLSQTPLVLELFLKFLVLDKNQTRSPFELHLDTRLAELLE